MDFFRMACHRQWQRISIAANASSNGGYLGEHSYFAFTSMVQMMLGVQRWHDVRILGDAMPLWFPACRAQQLPFASFWGSHLGFPAKRLPSDV